MAEDQHSVAQLIERIAGDIMSANTDDLSTLGSLCAHLEQLHTALPATQPMLANLVATLNAALEKIILGESGKIEDPLGVVVQGIALVQRMHHEFERTEKEQIEASPLLREIVQLSGRKPSNPSEESTVAQEENGGSALETEVAASPLMDASAASPKEDGVPSPDIEDSDASFEAESEEGPRVYSSEEIDPDIFADFSTEAEEHLEAAEKTLLELEGQPTNPELLNTVFRSFHTIKGGASFLNLQEVTRVAHAVEDVLDTARREQLTLDSGILDVILESVDLLGVLMESTADHLEGGTTPLSDIRPFLARIASVRSGEPLPETELSSSVTEAEGERPAADPSTPPAADSPAQAPKELVRGVSPAKNTDQHVVRVPTDKLDQLVNMVGELVITQTQVSQNPAILGLDNQKLLKDISQLAKISNDIQEVSMSMRMVPIRSTFERMARIVRDLSRKCGKEITLEMSGEDTELDKNVVEELVDPLTHMVRNAVDHGVETPEDRLKAGKNRKGLVRLEAYHQGGSIVIELKDDGKGLDRAKIHKKAVERGLIQADEELTDKEVYDLVFQPGFSTAEQITDVSGRGVGTDVVRKSIEKLRGKVEVDSQPSQGSIFTIRLPLTLAIIDGMVIGVGEHRYILPLISIIRSLQPNLDDIATVMGKGEMVKVKEELFPLVRLYERFSVEPRYVEPSEGLVVLLEAESARYALLVDELIGMQQVVIKALDEDLRSEQCLSGCAILGDGQVGLILDPNGLVLPRSQPINVPNVGV